MLRLLIQKTAWQLDTEGEFSASDKVSMCNYWANRLCCEAADRAMQVHGGLGYSRHKPFEHIYRHHRRYRITEGAEEIQMRRVAGYLFGFMGQKSPKGTLDNISPLHYYITLSIQRAELRDQLFARIDAIVPTHEEDIHRRDECVGMPGHDGRRPS